jgi:hypothetical protein
MSRRLRASVGERAQAAPRPPKGAGLVARSAEQKVFHDLSNHLYAARLCSDALKGDPACLAAQAEAITMLAAAIDDAMAKLTELRAALSIEGNQAGRATSRSVASRRSKSTGLVR